MSDALTWLGILFCLSQSATFSGLNLAVFSLSRLRLEAAAEDGDDRARRILEFRRDANFTLVTILWGNVAINVLLTLLAESLLAGVAAFVFSTIVITFIGEIIPQAYFSRHALRVAAWLSPLLRFYQILLWPIARPVARLLDLWVGPEGIQWLREAELRQILRQHGRSGEGDVSQLEATGAVNFLALDDLPVSREGEPLDPRSVIALPVENGRPVFPAMKSSADDPFLKRLEASGRKWVVITDETGQPQCVVNAYLFLRDALFAGDAFDPVALCHRPLVVHDGSQPLGRVLGRLSVDPERPGDDVIDKDLILVWTDREKRILTGADILGRLLRGIVANPDAKRWPSD
jgi:metal transporter CNNM